MGEKPMMKRNRFARFDRVPCGLQAGLKRGEIIDQQGRMRCAGGGVIGVDADMEMGCARDKPAPLRGQAILSLIHI